jgi:large subunit ribosomal protein L3
VTQQNLEVISTDDEAGVILVRGAVPGPNGGFVLVSDAIKVARPKDAPYPAAVGGTPAADAPSADGSPDTGAERSAGDADKKD